MSETNEQELETPAQLEVHPSVASEKALAGMERLPRRSAYPPHLLLVVAAGVALLSAESTADLGYHLLGPSAPIDLGEPGHYSIEQRAGELDGQYVRVAGLVGGERASYDQYVVSPLLGTTVLVRRTGPQAALPADVVERYEAKGRLIRLDNEPANVVVRMFRPAARYTKMRLKFHSVADRSDAFLLLDGEVPRARAWPIVAPLLSWLLVGGLVFGAWRSARMRREHAEAMKRLLRAY